MKRLLLVLTILLLSVFAASAQDETSNDPRVNEDANACYAGGTMEGKCNVDFDENGTVDDYEVAWAWECGWYLIRYEAAMISSVPSRCATVIHVPYSICYETSFGYDFAMVGRPNTADNVVFFPFVQGCNGEAYPGGVSIVVTGNSFAEAYANCDALGHVFFLESLKNLGYNAPDDYWGCVAF